MKTNLLSQTYSEFVSHFQKTLGKGEFYSRPLYVSAMKEGSFSPKDLAPFKNYPQILPSVLANYTLELPEKVFQEKSGATIKLGFKTFDKLPIESVIIPMKTYYSICISTQVGCAMACAFCQTGKMGFTRNLEAEEIVSQFWYAKNTLKLPIRNVVLMGMGEPLHNLKNVLKALDILSDNFGPNIKKDYLTLSTSGYLPGIIELSKRGPSKVKLALSINAGTNQTRNKIMPINKTYPLQKIKEVLLNFPLPKRDKFFFEYVLIKDLNDSEEEARAFLDFMDGLPSRVNLIPYNPSPGSPFEAPSAETIEKFYQILHKSGHRVIRRTPKGDKISAACGQLGSEILKA